MSDEPKAEAPKKKKGKMGKLLVLVGGAALLIGGGVGGGLYAAKSGLIGGGGHAAPAVDPNQPHLVAKADQKRPKEGGEGGHGGGESASAHSGGVPTPVGIGGERYASNYYQLDKDFTANLQDSVHFVQVGIAISTPYDDKVIENIKTNDIAIRSAILLALGDTNEEQVFTSEGKRTLQKRLAKAINDTLEQKEGFGGVSNVYFTNFVVQ